jgi:threonine synthase
LINDEVEGIWKKAFVAQTKHYSGYLPENIEENDEKLQLGCTPAYSAFRKSPQLRAHTFVSGNI